MSAQEVNQHSGPTYLQRHNSQQYRLNSGSLGGAESPGASGGINDRGDSISAMAVYQEGSNRAPGYISSGTDGDNSAGGGNEKHYRHQKPQNFNFHPAQLQAMAHMGNRTRLSGGGTSKSSHGGGKGKSSYR